MAKVLLIEDEPLLALGATDALVEAGYDVCGVAESANAALALAAEHDPDLAIVDVRIAGDRDGIAAAEELVKRRRLRILYATANCAEVRRRARVGDGCLSKPYTAEWLIAALKIVEHRDAADDITAPPGFFSIGC